MTVLARERGTELKRYGYLLCGSEADAGDLVQEALVRVCAHPRARWSPQEAEAYVRKTMLHFYLDQRKRRWRWARLSPRLAERSPECATNALDTRADIMRVLREFSPRQRACVILYYYEDLPLQAIGERLGCGVGTVKRHLDDARKRFAKAWAPERARTP